MRNKSWRLIGGAAAGIAAVAAITVGASGGFAGDTPPGPGQVPGSGEVRVVEAEIVETPQVSAAGVGGAASRPAAARPKKPQLLYLETQPQTLAPGPVGFKVGSCPGKAKAINGYYFINGTETGFGLDAQGDSPIRGLRQWAFYLDGGDAGVSNVTFGLICLKNVK